MGLSELLAAAASDGHTGFGPHQLQARPDSSHKLGQIVDKHQLRRIRDHQHDV